jgi:pimeloyl-ACP methyl ester carboxylesterase
VTFAATVCLDYGHFPPEERPEEVAAELLAFWSSKNAIAES